MSKFHDNPGYRPSALEPTDTVSVIFIYPDGTEKQRDNILARTLYWPKDRPIVIKKWKRT